MTRRDYVEVASRLKGVRLNAPGDGAVGVYNHALDTAARAIAEYCAIRDAHFDRVRFLQNAGVPVFVPQGTRT